MFPLVLQDSLPHGSSNARSSTLWMWPYQAGARAVPIHDALAELVVGVPGKLVQLTLGLMSLADSKVVVGLPLTVTLSSTTAPVVEFQPVPSALGTRSSKARLVLTRKTTRTVPPQVWPAGIAA